MDDYNQTIIKTKEEIRKKLEKVEYCIFKCTSEREMYRNERADLHYKKFLHRKYREKIETEKQNAIYIGSLLALFLGLYASIITNPVSTSLLAVSLIASSIASLTAAKAYYEYKVKDYKKELEKINLPYVEDQIKECDQKIDNLTLEINMYEEKELGYKKINNEINSFEMKKNENYSEKDIEKIKTLKL